MLQDLLPQAERIAAKLKARKETVSVAESSTAGMISAALLAIPGASAYFIGGAVVYTRQSRTELLRVTEAELAALTGITPSTEPYALLFARKIKERLATTWSVASQPHHISIPPMLISSSHGIVVTTRPHRAARFRRA